MTYVKKYTIFYKLFVIVVLQGVSNGNVLSSKAVNLRQKFSEIALVTIGNSAFPKYTWLVKGFSKTTQNEKETTLKKVTVSPSSNEKLLWDAQREMVDSVQENRCEIA